MRFASSLTNPERAINGVLCSDGAVRRLYHLGDRRGVCGRRELYMLEIVIFHMCGSHMRVMWSAINCVATLVHGER